MIKGEDSMRVIKDEMGFWIKSTYDQLNHLTAPLLKKANLTPRQQEILWYIRLHKDETVTQKGLEVAFGISHPTISRLLKALENKKFIRTYLNPEKRTMKIVELNQYEEQEADKVVRRIEVQMTAGFTPEERKQAMSYLIRMHRNLKTNT
jgi:DNA-binding MarR family transcriptional regulator